jgi:hypothetical protein
MIVHMKCLRSTTSPRQNMTFLVFLSLANPKPLTMRSKDARGRDFVRPSASISPVGVRTRSMTSASTYSLMAWCLIAICLERLPVTGLRAKSTAPLLSQWRGMGGGYLIPQLLKECFVPRSLIRGFTDTHVFCFCGGLGNCLLLSRRP